MLSSSIISAILKSKIKKKLPNQPVQIYNMGVPAGSLETSYRVLKNWIDVIQPRAVFLFTPPGWRREIIKEKEIDFILVNPEKGWICLEVKGGAISRDESGWKQSEKRIDDTIAKKIR